MLRAAIVEKSKEHREYIRASLTGINMDIQVSEYADEYDYLDDLNEDASSFDILLLNTTIHREGDGLELAAKVRARSRKVMICFITDSQQFEDAYKDLQAKGMEKLIVDLRDNPGGVLSSVCDVLRQILPEGLIVDTEDKYGEKQEMKCDGDTPIDIPLAVLVNENSASASEIFAGAVKDYEIGTIVGTTTYGKGIVQSIRQLSDGSAVKLTTAKYFTPKGNDIHKVGITPDVEVKLDASLLNRTDYTHDEDNQLQAAIEAVSR